MAELNQSIIQWINALPSSDQEELQEVDKVDDTDLEMDLLIDLLKEGRDLKRLREIYRKLSHDLDAEEDSRE